MANDIPQKQNEDGALRRLLAQRRLYSRAKKIAALQFLAAVLGPAVLVLLDLYEPAAKNWVALTGLILVVVNEGIFDRIKESFQERAARHQESFDTDVLSLPWSNLTAGEPLEREELFDPALSELNTKDLRDWYSPAVGEIPLPIARITCQRTSSFWDSEQRRTYQGSLYGLVTLLIIAAIVFAVWRQLSLVDFVVAIAAPVLPFVMWALGEARAHSQAADRLDRLRSYVTVAWSRILEGTVSSEELGVESRRLQDALYDHRRLSPMVFDFLYWLLRPKLEAQVRASAEDQIKELRERGRV